MVHPTPALFVGIDAHLETLAVAVFPEDSDQPEPAKVLPNEPGKTRALFRRLQRRGSVHAVYEAGCLGFSLHRQLSALGVDCIVAAPSRIPVLPGDRRKTDRLDARKLAVFLRGGQLTPVSPPSPETEAVRGLVRSRDAQREDVVRSRHRILKFLLVRGLSFREGKNWTQAHLAWLHRLRLPLDDDQETLDGLLQELDQRLTSLAILDGRIERRAQREDLRGAVAALRAFRGVDTLTAVAVAAEIGDPRRFSSARKVASYCGLVPSEHSSGTKVRRGGITRAGNPRLRRSLVESAQCYGRPIRHGHAIRKRREAAPAWAVQAALRAERRLGARYRALAARKHGNQAKVAVARELVGFLWAALLREQESRA